MVTSPPNQEGALPFVHRVRATAAVGVVLVEWASSRSESHHPSGPRCRDGPISISRRTRATSPSATTPWCAEARRLLRTPGGAACVPHIARERDAVPRDEGRGCYCGDALTVEILHPSLTPETPRLRRRRRKRQSTSSSRSAGCSGCRCRSTTFFPSSSRTTSSPRCPTSTSCSSLRCRCAHLRYSRPSAPAFL